MDSSYELKSAGCSRNYSERAEGIHVNLRSVKGQFTPNRDNVLPRRANCKAACFRKA